VEVEWGVGASPMICNGKLYFVANAEARVFPVETVELKSVAIRSDALHHDVRTNDVSTILQPQIKVRLLAIPNIQ
jgi:hypothetical protein